MPQPKLRIQRKPNHKTLPMSSDSQKNYAECEDSARVVEAGKSSGESVRHNTSTVENSSGDQSAVYSELKKEGSLEHLSADLQPGQSVGCDEHKGDRTDQHVQAEFADEDEQQNNQSVGSEEHQSESASLPVPADFPDDEEEQQEELFEHFGIMVDKGQAMIRIDKFLTYRMENSSRNRIQAAADSGNILVNGKPVKSSYKIKPLDQISIVMPYPRREVEIIPENIPLDIPYEDDDIIIVNKPAGLVVHPGHGNYTGTLVNALTYHLSDLPLFQEGDMRAGLVHRIDKNTSGLLVVAKNEKAHAKLAKQFFDHTIERRYVALVWGNFDDDEGTVTGHIGRSHRDRLKMAVFADGSDGKHAVTHYKVLKRYGYVTLLELKLETGRTHQIRVHMEWTGHPLFNDERYGGDRILKGTTFTKYKQFIENCFSAMPRHALHARSLGFTHPSTKQEVYFETPLPQDMSAVLDKWDTYVANRNTFEEE